MYYQRGRKPGLGIRCFNVEQTSKLAGDDRKWCSQPRQAADARRGHIFRYIEQLILNKTVPISRDFFNQVQRELGSYIPGRAARGARQRDGSGEDGLKSSLKRTAVSVSRNRSQSDRESSGY